MRRSLLAILACPDCRGSVELSGVESEDDAGIVNGTLKCTKCAREFRIIDGIPHMMPAGTEKE